MASPRQALYICRAASSLDNKTPSFAEVTFRGNSVTNEGVVLAEDFGTVNTRYLGGKDYIMYSPYTILGG
jgi:hypothetical protein